jgi:hypothetical protein
MSKITNVLESADVHKKYALVQMIIDDIKWQTWTVRMVVAAYRTIHATVKQGRKKSQMTQQRQKPWLGRKYLPVFI